MHCQKCKQLINYRPPSYICMICQEKLSPRDLQVYLLEVNICFHKILYNERGFKQMN
jgi:DNA-directed RNA polymerase subunit RPC12/RpoP